MKMKLIVSMAITFIIPSIVMAGSFDVIKDQPSGSSGNISVQANAQELVSLSIGDTGTNGLVNGSSGLIDFGTVDSACVNSGNAGVTCTKETGKARYKGKFSITPSRTGGTGNLKVQANRIAGGTLNSTDGLAIQNDTGSLTNLDSNNIDVIANGSSGVAIDKDIAIRVYTNNTGSLSGTIKFTVSLGL